MAIFVVGLRWFIPLAQMEEALNNERYSPNENPKECVTNKNIQNLQNVRC